MVDNEDKCKDGQKVDESVTHSGYRYGDGTFGEGGTVKDILEADD